MGKYIVLIIVLFTFVIGQAQESTTDYIYSSDGFEVKTSIYGTGSDRISSTGLYSKDGKMLVAAISSSSPFVSAPFYVLDGCETICSGAFQGCSGFIVYIPSTVQFIAPNAITSKVHYIGGSTKDYFYRSNRFGGIQDGCREGGYSGSTSTPVVESNAIEISRYNIHGMKLEEPMNGVNILQMSDGTTEKILVK